ncbi:VOC family protein [Brachybacterium aquaticum]|uniref:VOC family protein n=1 Tax=Brachybacterium aquaticum TaxID=1432564 RepID=UPI001FE5424C|nr:VOC family protein [Brachybacterium aquaticum]
MTTTSPALTIHSSFLPHTDPEASLAFYRDVLGSADLDVTFAALEAAGAEIVQEPVDQDYGIRDCAVRDPAGNMVRIQQAQS